uniref:Transmembrane domain-containing protein n=1 Tax=Panagrellus redivivus TaxID=6233 RepID=A0A7E4UXG7_PANRE
MAAGPADPTLNAINKISAPVRQVNKIIGSFVVACMVLMTASLFRRIGIEDWNSVAKLVWNGGVLQHCYNATVVVSDYPSILKRFELEAYTKLCFRFALMFPATSRVVHAFIRYKYFELKILKGDSRRDGCIMECIYKMTPYLLAIQTVFAASTLILNGMADNLVVPTIINKSMFCLICFTILYMITIVILDFRESHKNPLLYYSTPRYMIRFIGFMCFATCAFPTFMNFLYYLDKRQCNTNATTPLAAFTEYIAISGISMFHFSELFDLELVHFFVFEIK